MLSREMLLRVAHMSLEAVNSELVNQNTGRRTRTISFSFASLSDIPIYMKFVNLKVKVSFSISEFLSTRHNYLQLYILSLKDLTCNL